MLQNKKNITKAGIRWAAAISILSVTACSLDVSNPNSLIEDDLSNPSAATSIANGALWTVSEGIGYISAPYFVITDEGTWTGSRDAWQQLEKGNISDFNNEFVDAAWPFLTEGRWMADKAIAQLTIFNDDGVLEDPTDLARSYLYSALVRIVIADMFDDFVFSDKKEEGVPFGPAGMSVLYDQAVTSLNSAETIAVAEEDTDLRIRIVALRARAHHAKAIWGKVNTSVNTASPYVSAAAANTDAAAALGLMGAGSDYVWQLDYAVGEAWNDLAWQVNGRLELAVGSAISNTVVVGDTLPYDPIDNSLDVRIAASVATFGDVSSGTAYASLTIVSEREMHLILAEAALADGGDPTTHINHIRADLDGITAFAGQITDGAMLQHERRANLFMQGRRLSDMYRFGVTSVMWETSMDAVATPGTLFPIVIQERRANSNID